MATSYRMVVFSTFLLSCVALALLVSSLTTKHWIESTATLVSEGSSAQPSKINYGLFSGSLTRTALGTRNHDLSMTCLFKPNKCALSCKATSDARKAEVEALVAGGKPSFECPTARSTTSQTISNRRVLFTRDDEAERIFINAGVWISTVLFLSMAILFSVISAFFSVLNTARNPVEQIMGVFGLYIWNGVACGLCILVLIIWGIEFAVTITLDVAILDTLTGDFTSNGLATLGYSYWMVLAPLVLHAANIGLLYFRDYKLSHEPPPPKTAVEENVDGTLYLY